MHETALCQNIISTVLKTAETENLKKINKVIIAAGVLNQIVPDVMEQLRKTASWL